MMENHFVSFFKLDGVPILPPMVNDEVRATMAIYRQKAIEIEKRLQEKRIASVKKEEIIPSLPLEVDSPAWLDDTILDETKRRNAESSSVDNVPELPILEMPTLVSTVSEKEDLSALVIHNCVQSAVTSKSTDLQQCSSPSVNDSLGRKELTGTSEVKPANELESSHTSWSTFNRSPPKTGLSNWESSTRTVTPTSEELPWFPLVRSNTYNLEKPSIDLKTLDVAKHRTLFVDHKQNDSKDDVRQLRLDNRSKQHKENDLGSRSTVTLKSSTPIEFREKCCKETPEAHEKLEVDRMPVQPHPKHRTTSRRSNRSSTASGVESTRALQSVAKALTTHEQRMMELLKRQEEERLMLEKSFREKTQELVALCGKAIPAVPPAPDESGLVMPLGCRAITRTMTPEMHPASSVSQLSLCDVSYDSCTDTDDAAYQTCQANGTSEENVNNNENAPGDQPALFEANDSTMVIDDPSTRKTLDANGNEHMFSLPERLMEIQQCRAATTINAYARGYLTRRLFKTDEVQRIKRTIVDIVCFIMNHRSKKIRGEEAANGASVRRNAGKQIAFCLDRLHEIFINYTPKEQWQMIRRDRYLKKKSLATKSADSISE